MSGLQTMTDLVNQALGEISFGQSIADIDSLSKPAEDIRAVLPGVLEEVFSEFWWPELMADVSLNAMPDQDSFGRYRYSIPADWKRTREVRTSAPWEMIGRAIHTTAPAPLGIYYLKHEENVGVWGTFLKQCVYTLLAVRLAKVLKGDMNLAGSLMQVYEFKILPNAKTRLSRDMQSAQKRDPHVGDWRKAFRR